MKTKQTMTTAEFKTVLIHELNRYDMRVSRGECRVNIYRLGHLLAAAQEVFSDIGETFDAARAVQSLSTRFEPQFPPIARLIKKIAQ